MKLVFNKKSPSVNTLKKKSHRSVNIIEVQYVKPES